MSVHWLHQQGCIITLARPPSLRAFAPHLDLAVLDQLAPAGTKQQVGSKGGEARRSGRREKARLKPASASCMFQSLPTKAHSASSEQQVRQYACSRSLAQSSLMACTMARTGVRDPGSPLSLALSVSLFREMAPRASPPGPSPGSCASPHPCVQRALHLCPLLQHLAQQGTVVRDIEGREEPQRPHRETHHGRSRIVRVKQ